MRGFEGPVARQPPPPKLAAVELISCLEALEKGDDGCCTCLEAWVDLQEITRAVKLRCGHVVLCLICAGLLQKQCQRKFRDVQGVNPGLAKMEFSCPFCRVTIDNDCPDLSTM